jgi:acetyl esterase/lipase
MVVALCALLLSTSASAHAAARIEWSGPPRAGAGVLLLHGGAWRAHGTREVARLRPVARRFARLGLRVANADYRPGAASLTDARRALRRLGRGGRVCVYGESAGGQLALMLAARDGAIRCVITVGAVTDLGTLRADHAFSPVATLAERTWSHAPGGLADNSPLTFARHLRTPLLLAGLRRDPFVPSIQQRRLAARAPHARLMLLPRGGAPFVHGRAAPHAVHALAAAEDALLRRRLHLFV